MFLVVTYLNYAILAVMACVVVSGCAVSSHNDAAVIPAHSDSAIPSPAIKSFNRLPAPDISPPAIAPIAKQKLSIPIDDVLLAGEVTDVKTVIPATDLYTILADQVPLNEILHAIAQDTSTNIDVVGEIAGEISLSVENQPLEFILNEISTQLPVRYTISGDHIVVLEDKPFIQTYTVDYLNIKRVSESRVDLATQVGSMRTDVEGGASSQGGSNGSRLFVENKSENDLWTSLLANIAGLIGEKMEPDASVSENIFANRESGIVTVRATDAQHKMIDLLLYKVVQSAQRQVLIEATVVEVTLSDKFESGVDWKVLNDSQSGSFDYSQLLGGFPQAAEASAPITALLSYNNVTSAIGNLSTTLKLLQQFGEVQVLSSPKIIAMNNQPAVLKVVDNRVYFTFEVDRIQRENGDERTVVDSTVHSVPVGLVMNVTPFINQSDEVILNVRPTISRILNFAEDPSPALAGHSQVRNLIPEIQVREMESLLRVKSGDVAIIGGLMQNKVDNRSSGVPGLKSLPWLGKIFSHETKTLDKTELLVFLRPTVVNGAIKNSQGELQ